MGPRGRETTGPGLRLRPQYFPTGASPVILEVQGFPAEQAGVIAKPGGTAGLIVMKVKLPVPV